MFKNAQILTIYVMGEITLVLTLISSLGVYYIDSLNSACSFIIMISNVAFLLLGTLVSVVCALVIFIKNRSKKKHSMQINSKTSVIPCNLKHSYPKRSSVVNDFWVSPEDQHYNWKKPYENSNRSNSIVEKNKSGELDLSNHKLFNF